MAHARGRSDSDSLAQLRAIIAEPVVPTYSRSSPTLRALQGHRAKSSYRDLSSVVQPQSAVGPTLSQPQINDSAANANSADKLTSSRRSSLAARWQASLRETAAASEARARQLERARLASLQGEVSHLELRPGEMKGEDGSRFFVHHEQAQAVTDFGARRGTVSAAVHQWTDSSAATQASTTEQKSTHATQHPHISASATRSDSQGSAVPVGAASLPGVALVSSPKRSGLTRPMQATGVLLSPTAQHDHPMLHRVSLRSEVAELSTAAVFAGAAGGSSLASAAEGDARPPASGGSAIWPAVHAVTDAFAGNTQHSPRGGVPTSPYPAPPSLPPPQLDAAEPSVPEPRGSSQSTATQAPATVTTAVPESDSDSDSDEAAPPPTGSAALQGRDRRARALTAEQEALLIKTMSPRHRSDSNSSVLPAGTGTDTAQGTAFSFDGSPPRAPSAGSLSPRARAPSDGAAAAASSPLRTSRSDQAALPPTPSSPAPKLATGRPQSALRPSGAHTHYMLPHHSATVHTVPTVSPRAARQPPTQSSLSTAQPALPTARPSDGHAKHKSVRQQPPSRGAGSAPITPGLHLPQPAPAEESSSSDEDEQGLYAAPTTKQRQAEAAAASAQQLELYRRTMSPPVQSGSRTEPPSAAATPPAQAGTPEAELGYTAARASAKTKRLNALLYGVASPPQGEESTERGARTQRAAAHAAAQARMDAGGRHAAHVSASPVVGGGLVAEEAAAAGAGHTGGTPLAADDAYFHALDGFGDDDLKALGVGDVPLPEGQQAEGGAPLDTAQGGAVDLFADMPLIEGADGDADMDLDALLDAQWMAEQAGYMQEASSVATGHTGRR